MSVTTSTSAGQISGTSTKTSSLVQQGGAVLFGLVILFAVGFLPMSAAHNAAHDTRHSFTFPCH